MSPSAAKAASLASPIDLVPEFIPVAGPLDDAIVAALALRYVASAAGAQVIAEIGTAMKWCCGDSWRSRGSAEAGQPFAR